MNFRNQFKITYILVSELGGDFYKLFSPLLENCSITFDNGDIETATKKLDFINEKLVKTMEYAGICISDEEINDNGFSVNLN
jgi:hypothetical protein